MCRWMAYSGDPILVEELLFRPAHSIIDQSLQARLGEYTTNGDGFGIGWYGDSTTPAVYKSTHPAWNDRDLHEIAGQIRTPLLFAHIRASSGTPVQRSNCHPFRYGRWLWMHNGSLAGFQKMKRDLMLAVDPSLFADTVQLMYSGRIEVCSITLYVDSTGGTVWLKRMTNPLLLWSR